MSVRRLESIHVEAVKKAEERGEDEGRTKRNQPKFIDRYLEMLSIDPLYQNFLLASKIQALFRRAIVTASRIKTSLIFVFLNAL